MTTSESAFSARLAELTGYNISKVASLVDSHPVTAPDSEMSKVASMSIPELLNNDQFLKGFEDKLAEFTPELQEIVCGALGV